jgi:WD40 repeat protein
MDKDIYWPPDLPPEAKDLVDKLLDKDITKRLGCGSDGGQSIRKHKFFDGLNFNELSKMRPPVVPDELDNEIKGLGLNLSADLDVRTSEDELKMIESNVTVPLMQASTSDLNPELVDRVRRQQMLRTVYPELAKLPDRPAPLPSFQSEIVKMKTRSPIKSPKTPTTPINQLYTASPSRDNVLNSDEFTLRHIQVVTTLQGPVRCLAWAGAGDKIAASSNFLMNSFKLTTSEQKRDNMQLESLSSIDSGSTARYLEFSSNGELLAMDMQRHIGIVSKVKTSTECKTLQGHGMPITTVSWQKRNDAEPKLVAAGMDPNIYIWNAKRGKLLSTIRSGHVSYITSLSCQPSKSNTGGNLIASGGSEGLVLLFDVTTEKLCHTIQQHDRTVLEVTWRDEGILTSWSSDRSLRITDVNSNKAIKCLAFPSPVLKLQWSPDKKYFATAGKDMIRLYTFPDMKLVRTFHGPEGIDSSLISFDKESSLLAFTTSHTDTTPVVYDIFANAMIETKMNEVVRAHKAPITTLEWCPTKPILATGSFDRTVQFWGCEEMKIENLEVNDTKFFQDAENEESENEDVDE